MSIGYTEFNPIGLKTEIVSIDKDNKRATSNVLYKGNIIATITVDALTDHVTKEGSFKEITHLDKYGINEDSIITGQ